MMDVVNFSPARRSLWDHRPGGHWAPFLRPEVAAWLEGLGPSRRRELASLLASAGTCDADRALSDWLEEHGGLPYYRHFLAVRWGE